MTDGKRRKLGFGVGRRVTLMFATVTGAARGLSGHDLRRLPGLWVYALPFPKRCPFWTWQSWPSNVFPPLLRCAVDGAPLDELLVPTFLVPLLDADFRSQPELCRRLCLKKRWTVLYDCCDEKGCSARLDWVARFVVDLPFDSFSYCFRHPQPFLSWMPSSASSKDWWTEVSEIVACSV